MAKELSFKNLPFVPVEGQVIYVEQSFNEKLNKFIRNNYDWLRNTFRSQGLEFCFLPLLAEEAIGYNAPYLNDMERSNRVNQVQTLAKYVVEGTIDVPSLVFGLDIAVQDTANNTVLQVVPIETKWYISTRSTFVGLAKEVKQLTQSQSRRYKEIELKRKEKADPKPYPRVRYSLKVRREDDIRFSISEEPDTNFDFQSQLLIDEIKQRIDALRNRGVNTMFLHNLIDEGEHLSRLRITKDYRILLVDYNNLEIKLSILPKAVFFLFLRHPEGIRFKELSDYYSELLQIYLKMNPNGGRVKQEQSIRDITDPCNNSINEKCARIREAFVSNFDDRLAKNYYVTGKRGEVKRIMLDESMIIWEK